MYYSQTTLLLLSRHFRLFTQPFPSSFHYQTNPQEFPLATYPLQQENIFLEQEKISIK